MASESRNRLARILLVVVEVFPEIMRELITSCIPYTTLFNMIQSDLPMRDNLTATEQEMVQNLPNGYSGVDTIFVCKVIRHFKLLPPPSSGKWGKPVICSQNSISDDVERIRNFRNEICHRPEANVTENEMQHYFTEFIGLGSRFDSYFSSRSVRTEFEKRISLQRAMCIDPEMENKYILALERISELKLELKTKAKDNTTINIFFTDDVDNMIKETGNNQTGNEETVSMELRIYGVKNELDAREKIEAAKVILNEGRYTLQIKETTTGSLIISIDVTKAILQYRKTLLAEMYLLVDDILVICEHDSVVSTVLEQSKGTIIRTMKGRQKCVVLNVDVARTSLGSCDELGEAVADLVRDVAPVIDADSEGLGVIDVVVQAGEDCNDWTTQTFCCVCGNDVTPGKVTEKSHSKLLCRVCTEINDKTDICPLIMVINTDEQSIKCPRHDNETLSYFCSKHDLVCCKICRENEHPICQVYELSGSGFDFSTLIDATEQSIIDLTRVHSKLVDQCEENNTILRNSEYELVKEIQDIRITIDNALNRIERGVKTNVNEYTKVNSMIIRNLKQRSDNITTSSVALRRRLLDKRPESRIRGFICCKLIEQYMSKERQFIQSLVDETSLYDIDVSDKDSLKNFGECCSVISKPSKFNVEMPVRTKHGQTPLLTQRSSIHIVKIGDIAAKTLNAVTKIYKCVFLHSEYLLMKDSVNDYIWICNMNGEVTKHIRFESWPADIAVLSKNKIATALFEYGIAVIDLDNLNTEYINAGFVSAIASSNDVLVAVVNGRLVKIRDWRSEIHVLSQCCTASSISIDENDFIYYLDESQIHCLDWDGTPVFRQRINLPNIIDFTVNRKGETFVVTDNNLFRKSKNKTFEPLHVEGIKNPRSISCNDSCDMLVVTNNDGTTVTLFQIL